MEKVVFIGCGGQFRSMLPIINLLFANIKKQENEEWDIIGVIDTPDKKGTFIDESKKLECKYTDEDIPRLIKDGIFFINCLGVVPSSVRDNIRKTIHERIIELKGKILTIQSLTAIVHGRVSAGTIVHDKAFINTGTLIGENTIINTGAIIEHDCNIGKHCHICPGVVIMGGIKICDDVIVGAGSVVVTHIDKPGFYAGNPAVRIRLKGEVEVIPPSVRDFKKELGKKRIKKGKII